MATFAAYAQRSALDLPDDFKDSGNPIAVSAGAALLKQLANKEIYTSMEKNAQKFLNPIKEYADELNIPFSFKCLPT